MAESSGAVALAGVPRPAPAARSWVPSNRFLARAALLTAGLTAAGALLGLIRDQLLARAFGAGTGTDAFLVAWTVPEFAATLLIEDAMALILVPAFSRALARRAEGARPDPVRALVGSTLPDTALAMSAAAGALVLAAPWLVPLLAPGLPRTDLAVDCTRLTATCVLSFALAGYCSAALRAHGRFLAPAAIYLAYNIGIITAVVLLGPGWGVRAAAAGVAAGGVLMVLVQVPSLVGRLRAKGSRPGGSAAAGDPRGEGPPLLVLALLAPVLAFAVSRQSQVLVERFLAAPLPAGAISHLNYAQKVAQLPMVLSLMLCTVSFPVVARAMAAGDTAGARLRAERDLLLACAIVLVGAATVIAAAPQIVQLLFQRGAFDAADTRATAGVMRIYALGLLGQTLVGALVRCYFSASRPLWYPAAVMTGSVAVTAGAGLVWAGPWGAPGIAAANALGITLAAGLLLLGVAGQRVPLGARPVAGGLVRLVGPAALATAAGWTCAARVGSPLPAVLLTLAAVTAVFLASACACGAPVVPGLLRAAFGRPSPVRSPPTDHRSALVRSPLIRLLVRPLIRSASRRHAHAPSDIRETPHVTPVGGDVPLDRRPRRPRRRQE
ncbi:murein biosynthesis integral membrane protein MurJ [Streptomyces sp. SP18CS02]|uniref:murein biosynthesis integral membrane protein MurJ n=1 Tax=Streptomyces sp. SP18CS02 TaxID=3002531 RepID=UPI002E7A9071|nr:lipid II flippase MurJ [Streptomyces sp. SP18CS02]MEE1751108.1 lipid II flippase MurJ [Streptomyces sp. SP18CS02]